MLTINRRKALFLAAAGSAAIAAPMPLLAAEGDMYSMEKLMQTKGPEDRPIGGGEDAKVTFIEYASPTCPHCAAFHKDVYPGLKTQYIDTGKIRFILRPFMRNVLDAVVFMLAETADNDRYHTIIGTYFDTQAQWAQSPKPRDEMLKIALQLGFTEESFDAALTNQELFSRLEASGKQALDEFDLTGTPTFYINGKQLSGDKSLEELAKEIDPLLS